MRVKQIQKELQKEKEPIREEKFIPEIKVKELPSKFLPYPPDNTISYRPYVFGELVEFNESKLSEADIIKFISRGIFTSFPLMDLAYFDYMFISLLRKISSFGGNQFSFNYKCQKCGNEGKHTATIEEIDFNEISVPKLPLIATIGKHELHFMPLTLGKYLPLLNLDKIDRVKLFAAEVINMPQEEAEKIIYNAVGEDQILLDYIDEILYFGVKPMVVKCKNLIGKLNNPGENTEAVVCGFENTVEIDSPEVLTRPFRIDRESLRSRIRFGIS